MTTKKQKLQKQQAIDTWIVIALWVSAIWFSLARGFIYWHRRLGTSTTWPVGAYR